MVPCVCVCVCVHVCVCVFTEMGDRHGGWWELCCASFALVVFFPSSDSLEDFQSWWCQVRFFWEQVERKTAREKRTGSWGNAWEEGPLGNWFLWEAHGRELGSISQTFWEFRGKRRCLRVSVAVIKCHGHATWGGKGFVFHLSLPGHSPSSGDSEGTHGRSLETGTKAEAIEKCFLLTCSLSKPGAPTQGWHYPQWTEPSHINHPTYTKIFLRFANRLILWRHCLFKVSFQMTVAHVKLT